MDLLRTIYYKFSPRGRRMARRIYYFPIDFYESIFKKKNSMIPPKGKIFIGSGDFEQQGLHICDMLTKYAGLNKNSKVLDIGCGIGRVAVPLTNILGECGSYDGFDIVKDGIDWCNKKIASKFNNFHFKHIELKNDLYNLNTEEKAQNFQFPYPNNSFDCIILTSVFTHMMPEDVENYLSQIHRVIKPGGKCLATFFILNEEISQLMAIGKTYFKFHSFGDYALLYKNVKEANVAFHEKYLLNIFKENSLNTTLINRGKWSGNEQGLDFQDVVILEKR